MSQENPTEFSQASTQLDALCRNWSNYDMSTCENQTLAEIKIQTPHAFRFSLSFEAPNNHMSFDYYYTCFIGEDACCAGEDTEA